MKYKNLPLLTYKEVLAQLKDKENHLLLGNGFNRGLGINTSYTAIFEKMLENDHGIYKDAKSLIKANGDDLERFIGALKKDISDENIFLKKYVANKVKLDFMKAAHKIVKSEIKKVYDSKNEGVYLLLENFKNYFTLNYDSFLYLFLMNFKIDNDGKGITVAVPQSLKFMEDDMNESQNDIYSEIESARKTGVWSVDFGSANVTTCLSQLTKAEFIRQVKMYSKKKNKKWDNNHIKRAVNLLFEKENKTKLLNSVDDGFRQLELFGGKKELVFDSASETQNLFFLHGAFHIYKDGRDFKKITQTSKSLYERLEIILNDDQKNIVCVFREDGKFDEINVNEYLKNAYNKLVTLSGSMVIIGCSLSDNDQHIFDQIDRSKVDTIFISTLKESKDNDYRKAMAKFNNKNIVMFEAESISYEMPKDEN